MSIRASIFIAVALAVAGCGSSASTVDSTASAKSAPCKYGSSILPHVPEAPDSWRSGPRPAVALTCSGDAVDSGAAIVGYPVSGGGACVSAYSARLHEAFGELCEMPGSRWVSQCEGLGCVHYFRHDAKSTVLDGPVDPRTAGIRLDIDGKTPLEGVMHADVRGKLMRSIGGEEPFGFFAAYIPRCVEPSEVKVKLIAADGSVLGIADEWDVVVQKCPGSS